MKADMFDDPEDLEEEDDDASKPSIDEDDEEDDDGDNDNEEESTPVLPPARRMGRPPGSKNKRAATLEAEERIASAAATLSATKKAKPTLLEIADAAGIGGTEGSKRVKVSTALAAHGMRHAPEASSGVKRLNAAHRAYTDAALELAAAYAALEKA
jgi:hypothetical protein